MKAFIALLLILALTLCSCNIVIPNSNANNDKPTECTEHVDSDNNALCDLCKQNVLVWLDFYAVNDLHGKITDSDSQSGVNELTTYLKDALRTKDNAILLSSGDMWQGSSESNLTYGLMMTDWMNDVGFVSMTLGNHEYDWGEEYITKNLAAAEFPFLAINVYDKNTNEPMPYTRPSVMVERDGLKIGIIGAIGDCYSSISGEVVGDVYFKVGSELTQLVKEESTRLRNDGADLIVYSLHDGYGESTSSKKTVSDSEIRSYYDTALSNGFVDLVFEGHTHQSYILSDSKGVIHLQAGGENKAISHARIGVNSANGNKRVATAEIIKSSTYSRSEPDLIVDILLEKYKDEIAKAYEVLGTNTSYRDDSEIEQTVADLYYKVGMEKWGEKYDIVLGGGFLRTRSPYNLYAGQITYADVYSILPFDNAIVLCSISGYDLYYKFFNTSNADYYISYGSYGASVKDSIDFTHTYYLITDTYTSTYSYNNLTEVARYDAGVYARDLLADYIKEGHFGPTPPVDDTTGGGDSGNTGGGTTGGDNTGNTGGGTTGGSDSGNTGGGTTGGGDSGNTGGGTTGGGDTGNTGGGTTGGDNTGNTGGGTTGGDNTGNTGGGCTTHTDTDNNGFCDSCNEDVLVWIDLYAINDLHGKITDSDTQNGIEELTTYLKTAAAEKENMILLSTGDMWQGSSESNLTYGKMMTEWMNEVGFVSMTLGNHEYDWGEEYITKNLALAEFPFLAINVFDRTTGERAAYCDPSVIVERDGIKIGIIGAIGDCYSSIATDMSKNVYFKVGSELTQLVKAESERLKSEGVNLIVYALHDGYGSSSSGEKNVEASTIKSYYEAALSAGYVDIVFEAHTHQSYILSDSKGVIHLQGGGENKGISHALVYINTANGNKGVSTREIINSSVYSSYAPDPIVDELLKKYEDEISKAYEKLGYNATYRDDSVVEQLVADLYCQFGVELWGNEYNIVLGGGFIRTRSPYNLYAGDVTYSDVYSLLPFDNDIVLCSISGTNLLNKFINSTSSDYYIGFSEWGESIKDSIDPSKTYYIVTDSYTSGYASNKLTEIARFDGGTYARDLVAEYIKTGAWS